MAEITGTSGPITKINVLGGVPGAAGVSVTTTELDANGHLLIGKSNGVMTDVGKVKFDVTPEVQAAWDGAVAAETEATTQAGIATGAAANAKDSESKAAASAAAASGAAASEAAAKTSETNAALSATNAATSATTATTKAGVASSAATAAATSASNAALSESAASTSESHAATAASNAATSESNAATSESHAASSASAAAGSATAAASAATTAITTGLAAGGSIKAADDATLSAAKSYADSGVAQVNTWFLRGNGSPVGVITPASAGVQYVDLAATNGANIWISTGTTSTSWRVVDGDTGWRNVTNKCINLTSGSIHIRRIRDDLALYLTEVVSTATLNTNGENYTLPEGFYSLSWASIYSPALLGTGTPRVLIGDRLKLRVVGGGPTTAGQFVTLPGYLSGRPWPTTLPGTPA